MRTNKKRPSTLYTAVLSVLLCVAMLVGTTFAWFTDTASTGVNQIQSGNLSLTMTFATPGDPQWKPVDADTKLFSSTGWEPGYTQVVYIRIQNTGTLAWKHTVATNVVGESVATNVAGEALRLSQYLQMDLRTLHSDPTATTADRAQTGVDTAALSPEKCIGSFCHKGGKVLPGEEKIYQLTAYMPTSVGNEANYRGKIAPAITFGLKVTASQAVAETDSFGNTYDAEAPDYVAVRNRNELERAFVGAKPGEDLYVLLEADIDLGTGFTRIIREKHNNQVGVGIGNVVINGNGHTIYTACTQSTGVINVEYTESSRSITILDTVSRSGATMGTGDDTRGLSTFEMQNGTLNLVGCTIETADSQKGVGLKLLWSKEVTVNLTDCLVRASVPIEVENSADCTLNLQDCILESCYSGTPETKPEHIVRSGSTRITCNLTDTVQR